MCVSGVLYKPNNTSNLRQPKSTHILSLEFADVCKAIKKASQYRLLASKEWRLGKDINAYILKYIVLMQVDHYAGHQH